ncbi:2-hydroxychromene-2-carboxylate isomerase [Bradyrhizobium genosp. P]|uniref:2-hydroxychromene-2-carboxylate isomerase n=1 Tax=Bradyrhizobium genosp. P TaxID=83641 RepID=UPI003CF34015
MDGIAKSSDANVVYMPTSIFELMKATGNTPTSLECANKKKYVRADVERWVQAYQLPWRRNEHFRTIDLKFLLRAAVAAIKLDVGPPFVSKTFDGLFAQSLNLGDAAILREYLENAGLPGRQIVDLAGADATVQDLDHRTRLAAEKGLFGVPSFVVGSEVFFGNDRLDFVAAAATSNVQA